MPQARLELYDGLDIGAGSIDRGNVFLILDNRKHTIPIEVAGLGGKLLVASVDDGFLENVGLLDFGDEAGDGSGEFAALKVETGNVEITGFGVDECGEGV